MISLNLAKFGLDELVKEAKQFAASVFDRADLAPAKSLPAELCDRTPRFLKTRSGMRVSAVLTPEDMTTGSVSVSNELMASLWPATWMIAAVLGTIAHPVVGLLVLLAARFSTQILGQTYPSIGFGSLTTTIAALAGLVAPPVWLAVGIFTLHRPIVGYLRAEVARSRALERQGLAFAAESNPSHERMLEAHVRARAKQAEAVKADKSPTFVIGTATGAMTAVGDGYAPDRGNEIRMSAKDLETSLWVWGETGSGKTFGEMAPLARWWAENQLGGMLVLDGKGDLPVEMRSLPGYTLISPDASPYGLIEGLKAEDVADVIPNAMTGGDEKQDHWSRAARTCLRNAAVLLEAAAEVNNMDFPWTLISIRKLINDKAAAKAAIDAITASRLADDAKQDTMLGTAVRYFSQELPALADETYSSVTSTAAGWLSPIIGHRDLFGWAASEGGVDPTIVCRGGLVGVATPEYRYGKAGLACQMLIKARIYRAIRNRGSQWKSQEGQTRVLLLADEAQEVVGEAETSMTAVSRSLGLSFVMASQHIEGVIAKFGGNSGEAAAKAMLKNFRSMVCFASSPATLEYMSERMGSIMRRTEEGGVGSIAFGSIARQYIESGSHLGVGVLAGQRSALITPFLRRAEVNSRVSSMVSADGRMPIDVSKIDGFMAHYQAKVGRALKREEAEVFLKAPHTAIAEVMRGGVVRRDVVEVFRDSGK